MAASGVTPLAKYKLVFLGVSNQCESLVGGLGRGLRTGDANVKISFPRAACLQSFLHRVDRTTFHSGPRILHRTAHHRTHDASPWQVATQTGDPHAPHTSQSSTNRGSNSVHLDVTS